MSPETTELNNAPAPNEEARLSNIVHNLRTPLNHIIGLSEMLLETADADGMRGLIEGLTTTREAGIELASLLQDRAMISFSPQSGGEYWPLSEATRAAAGRILGFVELVLSEPATPQNQTYHQDLTVIRNAARNFVELARDSGLVILLDANRHWDQRSPSIHVVPDRSAVECGRVLIVDDEGTNREMLIRRLHREGHKPVGAHSGREALHLLRNDAFDVVLLDIQMPEMNGIEVLRILKRDDALKHLPVIMLSALTDVDRVARCIELGAEDYLPKPINAVLLQARLGACLEKKRLRDMEQAHFKALHAESERLRVTLRSLADAVVTTDDWGRVVLFNDVAAEMTGLSSDDAIGRPFAEVFPLTERTTGRPAPSIVADALAQDALVESCSDFAFKLPDGRERLVAARCAPTYAHDGKPLGTVVVVRDVTETEKMAEEILRTSKLQSLGVLAGGLAHDFNNMLTAVLGNLSLLMHRQNLPTDILQPLREAERGAVRAQELTRYLLTFAQGGAPMKQVLQLRALLEETCGFVLRGSHVHCEFHLADQLWETEADPHQLAQAVSNVVLNAVEATPAGGEISVHAENVSTPLFDAPQLPYGDYVRVAIRDRGAGISEENLARIYDPFFTTKKQARGLGLAAAYSIIQRHEGHISVDSTLHAGTTVTIYLPALRPSVTPLAFSVPAAAPAPTPEPAAPAVSTPAPPTPARRKRVLIMDDEDAIRGLLEMMLAHGSCDVVSTADGEAALAAHAESLASGQPFDLVIMDLTIPGGMGGKEAIRRLREKDQDLPAIVSSGYSNDPVMANYAAHGFDAVLPKPYVMKELLRVVEATVRKA